MPAGQEGGLAAEEDGGRSGLPRQSETESGRLAKQERRLLEALPGGASCAGGSQPGFAEVSGQTYSATRANLFCDKLTESVTTFMGRSAGRTNPVQLKLCFAEPQLSGIPVPISAGFLRSSLNYPTTSVISLAPRVSPLPAAHVP